MNFPRISIIIATYNSGPNFSKVLKSIRNQNYPKKCIEILVIDGGSTDKTVKIARKFGCKVFSNPNRDQVYGKFLGYKKAKGDFLLLIDSDEVLGNKNDIRRKIEVFKKNKEVHAVMSSGYSKPSNFPALTDYLNEFGDPFSLFMYRSPRNEDTFIPHMLNNYKISVNDPDKAIFNFNGNNLPFLELTSMAVLIDRNYIRKNIKTVFEKPAEHTHLFYLLCKKNAKIAIMKDDPIIHYSYSSLQGYLRKIRSRATSNIFQTEMGKAGFTGREDIQSRTFKFKKYQFIPYGLLVIPAFIDSIFLSISRKKIIYLTHTLLVLYTCLLIIFFYFKKMFGINTKLYKYGSK